MVNDCPHCAHCQHAHSVGMCPHAHNASHVNDCAHVHGCVQVFTVCAVLANVRMVNRVCSVRYWLLVVAIFCWNNAVYRVVE